MSAFAYLRGHLVAADHPAEWRYVDTDEAVKAPGRPCVRCGRLPVAEVGADACLGVLPGVKGACCGHGVAQPYVLFSDGTRLHPGDVDVWFAIMSRREGV